MNIAVLHYGKIQHIDLFKQNHELVYTKFFRGLENDVIDSYIVTSDDFNVDDKNYIFEKIDKEKCILQEPNIDECEITINNILLNNPENIAENKIRAIVYKNFRLECGYNLIFNSDKIYDVIVCCRADCKCMFNFDKSQIYEALSNNSIYVIGPHWWRPLSEMDCSPNDEHNTRRVNTGDLFYGVDFFFSTPMIISKISRIYSYLEKYNLEGKFRRFHDETIFQDFILMNKFNVNIIKWNPFLTKDDFSYEGDIYKHMNKSYIPILENKYTAIRT
jgi:hypothetical protein